MSRGRNKSDSEPSGFANHVLSFSQAPEKVEGEGLLYEGGEGSARLIADECLKYLFI
jgi:hypothetical protein